ncbi:MAG: hypothetical protein QOK39_1542 [Acidimicrobiaceae bacterium]|nr:hypothetical protein [Acidimicrobiaceae bacterium]
MDGTERLARLALRHHLAPAARAGTTLEVARSLVAVHSTDPASVVLGCMARTGGDVASVEQALYEDRSVVRMLGMRRTVFVVPTADIGIIHAACTRAIAIQQRRNLIQVIEEAGIATDGGGWLERVEGDTMTALLERGEALGQELSEAVPELRTQVSYGDETKKWAGVSALTTRVLFVLAAEGRIVRGRPRGSWISSQHRWVPREVWLDGREPRAEPAVGQAQAELARMWLASYGPGTAADLKWWTGWTMGDAKRALAAIDAVEVALEGSAVPGFVLPDDQDLLATVPGDSEPWAALLPALDSTVMGWVDREWFLGDQAQRAPLFDRSGNVGPTVWWGGQVVGAWAQRKDGEIAIALLRDVGTEAAASIDQLAGRLQRSTGDVRVTPRFRTPLERELAG